MATFLWSFIAFACGSLPFSVWVGRLLLGKEITRYGDTNPGATNVFRAGGRSAAGRRAGILAVPKGQREAALAVQEACEAEPREHTHREAGAQRGREDGAVAQRAPA